MATKIELSVLGALEVKVDGVDVPIAPGKAAVLCALAFVHPEPVHRDRLTKLIWRDPPANARKALQNQVKRVRADFGKEVIETVGSSYRLGQNVWISDRAAFMKSDVSVTDVNAFHAQLRLWRGTPYAELETATDVWLERDQLEARRQVLLSCVADSLVGSGSAERVQEFLETTRENDMSQNLAAHDDEFGTTSVANKAVVLSREQETVVHALTMLSKPVVADTRPQAIVVWGAAGSGKTTIVDAFVAERPEETIVLRAWCSESPAAAHETISGLLSSLPASVPLNPNLRLVDRLIAALTTFEQRVFVVIDDFHWATLALCELIERIAREAPLVTVVVATRDEIAAAEVLKPFVVASFEAPALDQTALVLLLRAAITPRPNGALMDTVASEIHFLTAGAPLFSVKLVEELSSAGAFIERSGSWSLRRDHPVPRSLFETVTSQYSVLGMRARHFIEMVATLHRIGGSSSTAYLDGHDVAAIAEAENSGLVRDRSMGLWVMHAEVSRAILESLSEGAKAELHALASDLLRDKAPIGAARHALRAPTLPNRVTVKLVESAASFAYDEADYPTAVQMWDSAVLLARDDDRPLGELIDLATRRCDAARRAGDERQLEIMSELVELVEASGDVERMALAVRVICKLGASSDVEPKPEFVAFVEQTLALDLSPAGRAGVLAASTQLYALNNYAVVRDRFIEAYELAIQIDDGDLIRFVLPGAYMSVAGPEDLELRTEIGLQLLRRSALDSDPTAEWEAHHLLWSCAALRGDRVRMAHHSNTAAGLPGSSAEPVKAATVAYMTATESYLAGDLVKAELAAARFLDLSNAVGPQRSLAVYGALLLGIRRDQGRIDEMVATIEGLHSAQPTIVGWKGVLAWVLAETGDTTRSASLLSDLIAGELATLPRDIAHTAVLYAIADGAATVSSPDECARLLELLAPYEGTMSWTGTCSLGPMDLAMGRLAASTQNPERADELLTAAEMMGRSNDWPAIELRAQLASAGTQPDSAASQQLVRTVFARAMQLELSGVAHQARRLRRG